MKPIIFPRECKKYFELQCNNDISLYTDMPEIKNINRYLEKLDPHYVMDIGAGIGRASVYLHNKYKWDNTIFYLLDGNGGEIQYDQLRTGKDEFYNSFYCAKLFCENNGLKIIQLNANKEWISYITKSIDLIYSFLAIGFHWPIDFYLDDIYSISKIGALIIFGIRGIEKREWINDQINKIDTNKFKIEELIQNESKDRDSVLILRKLMRL